MQTGGERLDNYFCFGIVSEKWSDSDPRYDKGNWFVCGDKSSIGWNPHNYYLIVNDKPYRKNKKKLS